MAFFIILIIIIIYCFLNRASGRKQPAPKRYGRSQAVAAPRTYSARVYESWKFQPTEIFKSQAVSFTKLNTFQKCPHMFELIYLCGIEDKSGKAAQVGQVVHKIVELYTVRHNNSMPGRLKHSSAVAELLSLYDEAASCTGLEYSIARSELETYLQNFAVLNQATSGDIKVTEHICDSLVGAYNLKCIIDRIDGSLESGGRVIDYKTGNPKNASAKQLNLYAYALCMGSFKPFSLQFQFLKTGESRTWDYNSKNHSATEKWLLESIAKIEGARNFPMNKCALCNYCGVANYC